MKIGNYLRENYIYIYIYRTIESIYKEIMNAGDIVFVQNV